MQGYRRVQGLQVCTSLSFNLSFAHSDDACAHPTHHRTGSENNPSIFTINVCALNQLNATTYANTVVRYLIPCA